MRTSSHGSALRLGPGGFSGGGCVPPGGRTLVCAPVYAAAAAAPPVRTRVAIWVSLETAPPRLTRRSSSAIWRAEWWRSAGSFEPAPASRPARAPPTRAGSACGSSGGGSRHLLHRDLDRRVAGERQLAGQHLVEHDPHRVEVGLRARRRDRAPARARGTARCPRSIRPRSSAAMFAARAMPKSVTLSRPSSVRIMLWGLMSRWTTPWRWANSSASSAWAAQFDRPRPRAAAPGS